MQLFGTAPGRFEPRLCSTLANEGTTPCLPGRLGGPGDPARGGSGATPPAEARAAPARGPAAGVECGARARIVRAPRGLAASPAPAFPRLRREPAGRKGGEVKRALGAAAGRDGLPGAGGTNLGLGPEERGPRPACSRGAASSSPAGKPRSLHPEHAGRSSSTWRGNRNGETGGAVTCREWTGLEASRSRAASGASWAMVYRHVGRLGAQRRR